MNNATTPTTIDLSPWRKLQTLQINHIEHNQNKSLLIFSTSSGFRILDPTSFSLLSKIDNYQEVIGPLKKASVLYNSRGICFLGNESNISFPPHHGIFWDESQKRKFALIIIKNNVQISTFYGTKNILFVLLTTGTMLLFEVKTGNGVRKIENVKLDENLISITSFNPVVGAYVISSEKYTDNIIGINRYKVDESSGKIISKQENIAILTQFDNGKFITFPDNNCGVILALSQYENKIHVYSTYDNELLYCIFGGDQQFTLRNFTFDTHLKFGFYILNNQTGEMFKLKDNADNFICHCRQHPDNEVRKKGRRNTTSFFGSFLSKMFGDISEVFLDCNLTGTGDKFYTSFNKNKKNEFVMIGYDEGKVQVFEYNRRKDNGLRMVKEIELFETVKVKE